MIISAVLYFQVMLTFTPFSDLSSDIIWRNIDTGLYFTEIDAPIKSDVGDSKITILKIEPVYYNFKLISSKEQQTKNKNAKEWADQENLLAVVNAGMFQLDFQTSAGYMKNYEFINNPNFNKDNTILAFNRKTDEVPEVQIIDLKCQDWNSVKNSYHSYVQGIRMIDCNQQNRWTQQEKRFSIVCVAVDMDGRVLFIFSRSPYSGHDLIRNLQRLDLNIYNAMYLEGGPEASLYIKHKGFEYGAMGSFEINFNENDDNDFYWPLPNVIGITRK